MGNNNIDLASVLAQLLTMVENNNGIIESDNSSKKLNSNPSNPKTEKSFDNLDIVKGSGVYYVAPKKDKDGNYERMTGARLSHLKTLAEENKAVYTAPKKVKGGKNPVWEPFYITCKTKKVAEAIVEANIKGCKEWAKANAKTTTTSSLPEALR